MFFFNDTATTEIYTLSLHDALPIWLQPAGDPAPPRRAARDGRADPLGGPAAAALAQRGGRAGGCRARSEEHTSELQSRQYLVCRLLLEKKKVLHSPSALPSNLSVSP